MNNQIYQEASDWFVRMRDGEGDASAQGALLSWLKRSPDHVSAYLDIAAIWRESAHSQVDSHLDVPGRIAMARADGDVAELRPSPQTTAPHRRTRLRYFAAAACALLVAAPVFLAVTKWMAPDHSTRIGEVRSVLLPDGSTVELNSGSAVDIDFDGKRRRVELVRGQALFRVAKDSTRPFIVTTPDASVQAVGTVFDVYRREAGAVVTVLEGSVAVLSADGSPAPVLLTAGKQALAKAGGVTAPAAVNLSTVLAWTRRQLVFEFTPLAEAAAEFNRYNDRKLIVEGEGLRAFRISAIFESTDPATLVRFLRDMPDVRVAETDRTIVVSPGGFSRN